MFYFTRGVKASAIRRRTAPIHCYAGPNGSGKTAAMVFDGIPALRAGVPILSTVRVHDIVNPRPCDDPSCTSLRHGKPGHMAAAPNWVPFTGWDPFLDFTEGEIWMDEVTGVANATDYASLPSPVADKLMQLRRAEVVLRWTSPAFGNGVKKIRQVTQAVTVCRGMAKRSADDHVWAMNRLFMWLTFDARDMEDFDNQAKKLKAYVRQLVWMPDSFGAYDTFEDVLSLAEPLWGGSCLTCGGKLVQPRCSCGTVQTGADVRRASRGSAAALLSAAGAEQTVIDNDPTAVMRRLADVAAAVSR